MKETGLMFKAPLVRSILDGTKTQTRRVVKNQPFDRSWSTKGHKIGYMSGRAANGDEVDGLIAYSESSGGEWHAKCPMGQPGDRIYVRETFAPFERNCCYRADGDHADLRPWKPAIHMPKALARIWLDITGVRLERLQDISEADCRAEGAHGGHGSIPGYAYSATPLEHFQHIWTSTGGDWAANPWCWVIDFKRDQAQKGL